MHRPLLSLGREGRSKARSLPEGDEVGAAFLGDSLLVANWAPTELSKNPFPEDALGAAACLGAAFLGDSVLLANWAPTELSKKPFPEDALGAAAGLGAAFLGDSDLVANWAPTELSKNPPPEETFVGAACLGAAFSGALDPLVDWAATLLSKNDFVVPAANGWFSFMLGWVLAKTAFLRSLAAAFHYTDYQSVLVLTMWNSNKFEHTNSLRSVTRHPHGM